MLYGVQGTYFTRKRNNRRGISYTLFKVEKNSNAKTLKINKHSYNSSLKISAKLISLLPIYKEFLEIVEKI